MGKERENNEMEKGRLKDEETNAMRKQCGNGEENKELEEMQEGTSRSVERKRIRKEGREEEKM